MEQLAYSLIDRGLIPDFILRRVVRALCRQRLREIDRGSFEKNYAAKLKFIEDLRQRQNIAEQTDKANEQHYEVSTPFIMSCLGPCAKYSSCLYPTGKETIAEAEILMLEDYCTKSRLRDGMDILDLGCGWGSLALYLAQKYPRSRITAISNSSTQKEYIDVKARERDLHNLTIITGDVNDFEFPEGTRFDRILSIEMFEHMKNYQKLIKKIASWLKPKALSFTGESSLLFLHIFCHKDTPYHFESDDGWMAKTFFSGGTMMSHDLLLYFQDDVSIVDAWYLSGKHYSRTLEAWLKLQDRNREIGLAELEKDAKKRGLGAEEGRKVFFRFRLFYLTCAELFGLDGGQQWGVGHYLFMKRE